VTSANDSDEPLVFTDDEAASHLGRSCDAILGHQRPIERPVDDSVVLDAGNRAPVIIRRSRGYVPTPIPLPHECDLPGLCVGGELKSVVGVVRDGNVVLSQHLGDLQHARTYANFKHATEDLLKLFDVQPRWIAHDAHPGYVSTLYARQLAGALRVPRVPVQHHYAHAMSALVEHGLTGPALAVVCDGTGYGPDGTIWGGELLAVDLKGYKRLAHLQRIRLAGGDAAARQTWRSALSLLQAALGDGFLDHPAAARLAPQPEQARFVAQMLRTGTNCVMSSSAGRVFDGVAALLGLCATNSFEAQAPLALEAAAAARVGQLPPAKRPLFELRGNGCMTVDLTPLVREILNAHAHGTPAEELAALSHEQFVAAWEAAVVRASDATGLICVVLSGGVFCNEIVDRELWNRLMARGLHVLRHELVPPNDGGLALGQAALAGFRARRAQKVRG
jgi:hydrogenase maturation protein HypF